MCIKLWGLYQAKTGMATVVMNDKVDSAFPKPSKMNENLHFGLYVEGTHVQMSAGSFYFLMVLAMLW